MSDITLTATQRQTLLSLQDVTELQSRTQERLNTGKKVNSAVDNAVAYFQSQNLSNRASNFTTYKSNIDQSIQSLNVALTATSSVETLLQDLQGVLTGVASNTSSQNASATKQFNAIAKQLYQLVSDATYQGLNILNNSAATLTTTLSDRTASTFVVNGYNLQGTGKNALFTQSTAVFSSSGAVSYANLFTGKTAGEASILSAGFSQLNATTITATQTEDIINKATTILTAAIDQVQGITAALGANVNILQARSNFSASYSDVLSNGSDALTLADLNTEAANSQALSLRQQLGIQSLTTSATQNSSVLTLLRSS